MFSFSLTLYKLLYVFSFKSLRRQKKKNLKSFFSLWVHRVLIEHLLFFTCWILIIIITQCIYKFLFPGGSFSHSAVWNYQFYLSLLSAPGMLQRKVINIWQMTTNTYSSLKIYLKVCQRLRKCLCTCSLLFHISVQKWSKETEQREKMIKVFHYLFHYKTLTNEEIQFCSICCFTPPSITSFCYSKYLTNVLSWITNADRQGSSLLVASPWTLPLLELWRLLFFTNYVSDTLSRNTNSETRSMFASWLVHTTSADINLKLAPKHDLFLCNSHKTKTSHNLLTVPCTNEIKPHLLCCS